MATQDFDSEFDTDTYTPSRMGRAKDAIKEGLSDVQERFESSGMSLNWKKILPVALIGTVGAIIYSRRGNKKTSRSTSSRSRGKKLIPRKNATGSKGHSHRAQV